MHAAEQLSGDERFDAFQRRSSTTSSATRRRGAGCAPTTTATFLAAGWDAMHYQSCLRHRLRLSSACAGDHDRRHASPTSRLGTTVVARPRAPEQRDGRRRSPSTTRPPTGPRTPVSDYVATSGTLTLRATRTAEDVDVRSTRTASTEPDETFFLNLSNESSGTLLDPQSVVTITRQGLRLRRHRHLTPPPHRRRQCRPRLLRRRPRPPRTAAASSRSDASLSRGCWGMTPQPRASPDPLAALLRRAGPPPQALARRSGRALRRTRLVPARSGPARTSRSALVVGRR